MKSQEQWCLSFRDGKRRLKAVGVHRWAVMLMIGAGALWMNAAWAVPASPDGLVLMQGVEPVHLQLRGDEFFSWTETVDGFAVLYDEADSLWKYAQPVHRLPAFEVIPEPPEAVVGEVDPNTLGLIPYAMPDEALLKPARREQWQTMRGWPPVDLEVPLQGLGALAAVADGSPPPQPLISAAGIKTIRNIVLLACFSNHWNVSGGTVNSSYGKTQNDYTNLFNQVGYSADSAVGSVKDYYKEVSYARLTVESVVFKWVRLPQNESYYGTDGTGGTVKDLKWLEMIGDAINAADSAGLDFATGDSDGDGWVDCLTVIHSGHGQEITGNPTTCIWSKQGEMSSVSTKDGVKMKRAHTEPALRGATTSTSIIRIGVICHEMGHSFGLPDLYDYSNTFDGIGKWCLMAHGNWNGSEGNRPAHLSAYAKCMLGFVRPTTLHTQSSASLPRVEVADSVILLRDGMSNGEYYLLENRSRYGFDNDTANIFQGILIYHVDSKSLNNDLGTWAHPLVKIEEADGDNSLGTIESPTPVQAEAGDVWTSTSGLSGGFRDQTGNTSANAMLYQYVPYVRTDNTVSYSYLRASNFSAAGNAMSCTIQTLKTTLGKQTAYSSGYTVSWPACSQATKYEIQEGALATLTGFSDGAEDESAMFANWHLTGSARRSTAGKRTGSYSYLMQLLDSSSNWYSPVQSLTLQKPFTVTSSSAISFYLTSHLHADGGYLACDISKDSGATWISLGTYNGYINTWTLYTHNYTALNAKGINVGDSCIIRFVMNAEQAYGWSSFPDWGFGLDDIAITGVEIAGYGGWTTLDNTVTSTSYSVSPVGRTNGVYAYRVQAYANSAWQGYGPEGETTVILPTVTLSLLGAPSMPEVGGMVSVVATLSQTSPVTALVNLAYAGQATETNDFTATPPAITISPGNQSGMLNLMTVDDSIDETNETIVVTIASIINGEESGTQQVVATILDDDDPPAGSFEAWARIHSPGMDLPTAFTNDYNADGVPNGFDYAFGSNLASNAPLLNILPGIYATTNLPVLDIPLQMMSTVSYADILIEMTRSLSPASWFTNGTSAINLAAEPANRSWHVPKEVGTNAFFRLRGELK